MKPRLEPWNLGIPSLGTLDLCNSGTLQPCAATYCNLGTLKPYKTGTLEPWSCKTFSLTPPSSASSLPKRKRKKNAKDRNKKKDKSDDEDRLQVGGGGQKPTQLETESHRLETIVSKLKFFRQQVCSKQKKPCS